MAISQNKYINIVSDVGGGETIRQRDLMGRVFTANYLAPVGQVVEFTGGSAVALENIGEYFGVTSDEYAFASKYFQPNKKGMSPQKISFGGVSTSDTSAMIIGVRGVKLADIQAITTGTLSLTVNGELKEYDSINLSSATSLNAVATALTAVVTSDGLEVE